MLKKKGISFYKNYYNLKNKKLPIIDAKIALSKDYFSINKRDKWITNVHSRNLTHLFRSKYDAIISTSKSINKDNSLLNCRIDGLTKKTPDLVIIDRHLEIKKNFNIFKYSKGRKIFIYTIKRDYNKIGWLKRKNIKVILEKKMEDYEDYKRIFKSLLFKGYSRLFVETGITFTSFLIKHKLINNIYIFKTNYKLFKNGFNNTSINTIKKIKLKNRLKTFLYGDNVYMEKLK